MKITIIGVGNMGGAIARGLASDSLKGEHQICITNRSVVKLNSLKKECPSLNVETSFQEAVNYADLIILAVKPWVMEDLVKSLQFKPTQIIASVAAGINFEQLSTWAPSIKHFYRIIPNTAIALKQSMNIIASFGNDTVMDDLIIHLFNHLGTSLLLPEEKMDAATSISSCGIAYVLKYLQAAMQAGVELGLTPHEAKEMAAQSAIGAGSILLSSKDSHPSVEIDKVTTPGGLTIKGINELDKQGFVTAIIEAIKKSS